MDKFINLHTHDEYSNIRLKDSTNRIPRMIDYVANELGQKGFAMTNHDCLSNHVKYINTVKEMKKEGKIPQDFKYILGNEIYLLSEEEMNYQLENKLYVPFYHFILIALDEVGHAQLRELSSRAWGRSFSYRGMDRVPTFYSDIEEVVGRDTGHLIASTACLGSRFSRLALQYARMELCLEQGYYIDTYKKEPVYVSKEEAESTIEMLGDEIHEFLTWCKWFFGDNFHIEMQPSSQEDQIMYNKVAQRVAKAYKIPILLTTDAHYLNANEKAIHKAFLKSDEDDETFASGGRETDDFYETTYFMSGAELHELLPYFEKKFIDECINNTYKVYERVEQYDLYINQEVPEIPLPPIVSWFYNEEIVSLIDKELFPNIVAMRESDNEYDRYLYTLILKGMKERIAPEEYLATLVKVDLECKEVIGISKAKQTTMSGYFITLQKFVDIIWDEAESFVGVSRGSAAGFVINYLLQIVQINPLKQPVEMPHWRFISAERPDFPDIDIDISSHKRDIAFRKVREYYQSFGGEVVRVGTFKTESSKSAIQTACRGLGISSDIGTYLSSLIPITRGSVHGLHDTYYGNPNKELEPVTEFVNQVNQFEGLLELAIGIEDIISGRGVHPCGVCCFTDINRHTSIMKAPNGELITQYDLADNEYTGSIKMDFLNTKTMSMIQIATELLVEAGHMEWQGSLRQTYNKYLHPDVRNYDNPNYYEALNKGELISAFQFDSQVGNVALTSIRPTSLLEVANANSLMRLMSDHGEQPMEKYIRYKNDINEWYKDMEEFGLTPEEIKLVRKHLDKDNGVCSSQEGMMLLTMDEEVANFDVVQSNKLRKGCAKKVPKLIQQAKEMLFEQGIKNGASDKLLHYIWDEQISMQLGYSFSILHTIGYSHILLQQLELITNYPPIYWNTAVLLLESGAISQDTESDEDDKKEKTTNYGVVASAISNLQQHGVTVDLPNINKAQVGFTPHEDTNSIMFGFKGVSSINNDTAGLIIANRPFTSLDDFHKRMVEVKREVALSNGKTQNKSLVSSTQTINLIKAGAFDELEGRPRVEILEGYLHMLFPPKKAMTTANINAVMELGIIPTEYQEMLGLFNFKKFIATLPKHNDETSKTIKWHTLCVEGDDELTDYTTNFFHNNFGELQEGRDYYYDDHGCVNVALGTSRKGSLEAVLKEKIKPFTNWLNSPACIDTFNHITFEAKKQEVMQGSQSRWEMESMNYYYSEHELASVDKQKYGIVNFFDLPEEPEVIGFTQHGKNQYPKFALHRICGTVLDRDKNKHTITLLTEYGVVTLKMYSGQFSFYDKTISANDEETGKKVTLEESWFKRGTRLTCVGYRRGGQFKPKRYKNTIYQHSIQKIVEVDSDGSLILQSERVNF